jgi:hypothetical protein
MLQIATNTRTTRTARPGGYGWRRQALTLAVVEIMTWAVRSNRTRHTKTDDQIFARIDRWSGECKAAMGLPRDMSFFQCGDHIDFSGSAARKWSQAFDRMGQACQEALSHTETTVVFGALAYVVETCEDQVPGDRARAWDLLSRAVVALYKRCDPEFKAGDQGRAQRLGERLIETMD